MSRANTNSGCCRTDRFVSRVSLCCCSLFEPCLVVKNIVSNWSLLTVIVSSGRSWVIERSWCLYRKHVIKVDDKRDLLRVWGPSRFNPRPFPVFFSRWVSGVTGTICRPWRLPKQLRDSVLSVVSKPSESVNAVESETLSAWHCYCVNPFTNTNGGILKSVTMATTCPSSKKVNKNISYLASLSYFVFFFLSVHS